MPLELSEVAAPMIRPVIVMVQAVVAAMPKTAVVMTMELPEMADVAVMPPTDVLPAALAAGLVAAKNPAGKFSVILPPVGSAAWVLNTRVTATLALAATRSPAAMVNETAVG
jgi:hypothetical protein